MAGGGSFFSERAAAELPDAPSLAEQEDALREEAERRKEDRDFDLGFAEYERRLEEEALEAADQQHSGEPGRERS